MTTQSEQSHLEPLWRWIREREIIRRRKEELGLPPPWTDDPILAAYRFCNVRREDDRVTRWIAANVRMPFAGHPLLWLMLCLCRQINWPPTLVELIETPGAWPSHEEFSTDGIAAVLRRRQARGEKVYTGAYLIPAPRQKGADKYDHIARVVIGDLHRRRDRFADLHGQALQDVHAEIRRSSGWGDFLAYQAVVDMRFCPHLLAGAPDVSTWAAAGPGTIRGLHRLHGRPIQAALSQSQALLEMRAIHQIVEQSTGVPMDFSDIPNVLCETDKYLRVQRGEGKPRARYVPGRGA